MQEQQTQHSHVHSSSQTEGHPCCLRCCFDSRGLCCPSLSCCTFLIHPMRHPFHDARHSSHHNAQNIHLHSHLCTTRPCTAVCTSRSAAVTRSHTVHCVITVSKAWLSTLHKAQTRGCSTQKLSAHSSALLLESQSRRWLQTHQDPSESTTE